MWIEKLAFYVAAMAPVLFAWMWARRAHSTTARALLYRSSIACGVLVTVVWLVGWGIIATCGGNWLYGYRDCSLLGDATTNAIFKYLVLLSLTLVVFCVGLFFTCAIIEWRARYARSD